MKRFVYSLITLLQVGFLCNAAQVGFNKVGYITTEPFPNSFVYISSVIDAQGRIIAVGQTDSVNDDSHGLIVRYKEDGSLDTTFNNGTGFINTENGTNSSIYYSVALDVQGRIVTVGQTDFELDLDEENHGLIVRHNENGSLDTTFNGTGFIISKAINSFHYISLVIDTQGRIVVAGQTNNNGALIARFKSDGTLDTYFNQISAQSYNKVLIDNNNRIITVGLSFDLNGIIARFLSNGVLDTESNWNLQNFRESNNINKVSIGLLG
ncbi:MAG: hypothetical protein EBU90_09400 [Proteobacteria bacterium]|nr:hypothetical protein [Pseudomonadota bacterium]